VSNQNAPCHFGQQVFHALVVFVPKRSVSRNIFSANKVFFLLEDGFALAKTQQSGRLNSTRIDFKQEEADFPGISHKCQMLCFTASLLELYFL